MPGLLYDKDETCAVCGASFRVTKVRKSACPVLKRDSDFCVHYQNENPNLYDVWVCPHCGYAAAESSFGELLEAQRKLLRDWLPSQPPIGDFSGVRDAEHALAAYDRAIGCATAKHGRASQIAGLCLKAAWVHRVTGDPREADYVAKAATFYEQAYQSEQTPIGTMTDATLRYLIGELLRRSGRLNEARLYFSHLVSDPATRNDARIATLARDQFTLVKEQLAAQGGHSETVAPAAAAPAAKAPVAATSPMATTKPSAAPPAPAPAAAPAPAPRARTRVTASVPLYADQLEWARGVVRANPDAERLDTGAVLRAVIAVATSITPGQLKAKTEEELSASLIAALRNPSP